MKNRKLYSLLIVTVMIFALIAACTNDAPATPPATSTNGSGDTATPDNTGNDNAPPAGDIFEFEFYANYDWYDTAPIWGEDAVSSYMMELLNIKMNLTKPDIDPGQMMGIMISAGEIPDVMMIDRGPLFEQLVELDLLLPLDDFLPGSHYESNVDVSTVNMSRVNGQVYGMLNWATNAPAGNGGWVINKEIWEDLGSPPLATIEQLTDYLFMVRDANIEVDGIPVVPLQFGHSGTIQQFAIASHGFLPIAGMAEVDGGLKLYLTAKAAEDGLLWANKLWNEGLINHDHFLETPEQIEEKLAMGRFAVYAGQDLGHVGMNIRPVFLENNPGNDLTVIEPPAGPGVGQANIQLGEWSSLGWNIVVISKTAKNPERIFELLDFINSRFGQVLTYYGPQGYLWEELDGEGFPFLLKQTSDLTAEENDALGANVRWNKVGDATNTHIMEEAILSRIPREQWSWLNLYQSSTIWPHSFNGDRFLNIGPDPQEPEGIAVSEFRTLNDLHIPIIISAASPDAARAAIQDAIDAIYGQNFGLVEQYQTAIYQANLAKMAG